MPIFDSHAYLADTPFSSAMASREAVHRTLAHYGISAVALISGLGAHCDFMVGNRNLRDILDPAAGLFGWVTLNTGYPAESQEEQRRHMTRRAFVGAALFGYNGQPVLLDDAREILNAQRRFSKPVALHVPDAEAVHAARRIAAEFPAMKFVLLTMGGNDWHTAVAAAKQHLNLYLEISGSLDSDKIDAAAATLSPRKLLYGSGLPYADPSLTLALVRTAPTLNAADRERILSLNAVALLRTDSEERSDAEDNEEGLPSIGAGGHD